MTLTSGLLILAGAIGCGWFCSWAWRQIPTAQCTRCYSYDVAILAVEGYQDFCRCRDCGCEFLA